MKILIQTALSLEFEAVKAYLKDIKLISHPSTGTIYNQGKYLSGASQYDVLLTETGAGNLRAADETGRAIDFFKPDFVFFVGVAGGIKDVNLGDVVASTKVIGFEMGKDDTEFKPRFDSIPASYILEQIAKNVKREDNWRSKLLSQNEQIPQAFVQPIAAGEKVVSSNKSVTFTYLKRFCSDAVAVDMEGNGFLVAARPHHAHAIEVRGISDLIENKEEADATGSQPVAAANASAFTFAMIDQLSISSPISQNTDTLEFRLKFVNELTVLYPEGPEQRDIWKRAGGNVSILTNSASRKSQWFSAIEMLSLGGGGNSITMATLLNQVKDDFPNAILTIFG